jgi:hypothetical protein
MGRPRELYLHEVYSRSGFDVEIHPDVPGSEKHPDFRVEGLGERFYIEAVRVGEPPLDVGQQRRLREVEALLDSLRSEDYTIHFSWYAVGPAAPSTRQLRAEISAWLQALDPEDSNDSTTFQTIGAALEWIRDGWHLVFEAIRRPSVAASSTAAIGIRGPAEARAVDNAAGILRVLDSKANRYGTLDAPLVIAVLSNTEYPTHDYDIAHALYGLSSLPSASAALDPSSLFQTGHWLTRSGWRRGHAPQVVAAAELFPWSVTRVRPSLWKTLEEGVAMPVQPDWLQRAVTDAPEPYVPVDDGPSLEGLLGLPSGWLTARPEFR